MSKRNKRSKPQVKEQPAAQTESRQLQVTREYQGPIPSPDALMQYEQITPGLADRIMSMAERESAHRHNQEQALLAVNSKIELANAREVLLGQIFGFSIGVIAICAGVYLATSGNEIAGGLIGSGAILGLVSVFVLGRNKGLVEGKK